MKLKDEMVKMVNDENLSHLEITEVVLIQFNVIKNDYQ